MITYEIDEEKKIITCTLDGKEISRCAVKRLAKQLRHYSHNMITLDENQLILSDSYTGVAHYADDEENEFSVKIGKQIARKKAFVKFNEAMAKRYRKVMKNARYLYENTLCETYDYENIATEIKRKLKQY